MKTVGALAILLLAALAVPTVDAQAPTGLTLTVTPLAAPIPYAGAATLPVDVRVGCASILQAMQDSGGSAVLSVAPVSPPAWLTAAEATADLAGADSPQACLGGAEPGFLVQHFDIGLAVTKDAPAVVSTIVPFTATLGADSASVDATLVVAYNWNYTIVSDATFPMTVTGEKAVWNVTVTQASNARSMVMMENITASAGVLSGPASQAYENAAGLPVSKTFQFTWLAPTGEWSNATASFVAYGHYLLLTGQAGDYDEGTPVTYTFTAGHGDDHDHEDGGDGDKKSPAPVGAFLALGLVALAAFARRRA